jgi:hypothetical protein
MWYQIEFPSATTITEIKFKSPPIGRGRQGGLPPIQTTPHGFNVEASMDGKQWTSIVSNGESLRSPTTIRFAPVQTRFIRITLTKSEEIIHGERRGQPFDFEVAWTMRELRVYGY